jgi:hypothetical protein
LIKKLKKKKTALISSPMPGSEFPRPYAMFFFSSLNGLRSEVIVRFVDIGGIVDHHCFLIKKLKKKTSFD